MKKVTFYLFMASVLWLTTGTSCNQTELSNRNMNIEELESIIGRWKLETIKHPMNGQSFYYSQHNVVYEFKTDGVLVISGEAEIPIWPETGEYSYSFIDDEKGYGMVGLSYGLKIGNSTFWYRISSKELEINNAPLDGAVISLIKTN
jgi:hypothetical protein